ncbi:M20/M25/M40 family metallo-hydrolase [Metabacillus sp. B2-18]|uniref:M20/M25/M40 family metallo-hydrolase n=1 Tax=Metabacillus sp. B2-18 TaxID=2897333 RepID=UPI001E5DE2A9|nr:M20/M25/M40 family metallo-hydrolase [Metabacillus sp. B2-18]UGB32224.1 M20/M25/M40 family metallo-hydrolase [Metabacillus sp. B2-18]
MSIDAKMCSFYDTVQKWTSELVAIKSVNGTTGEVDILDKVESLLRSFHYFSERPCMVWTKVMKEDPIGRKNLFALVSGEKGPSNKVVLIHGHTDTVSTEDYGELEDFATKPEELMRKFQQLELSPDVKEDLESGEWYFGRGTVDMKSGVASHLCVLKYLSENPETFAGHILFMANPIEETTHGGIMDALSELQRLKTENNFEYVTAINADFVGPLYPGDTTRYIYLGAVGKLLPSFYIKGKETHVGQPFEGFDPNLVASKLVEKINLNMSLVDEAEGEYTLPPVALKMEDLKNTYNVQTPISSFVYFNYFVHKRTPDEVMIQLQTVATEAFNEVIDYLNEQYSYYSRKNSRQSENLPWTTRVMTYEQLMTKLLSEKGEVVKERIQEILVNNRDNDLRIITRQIVSELLKMDNDQSPVIVIFFSPPYVPHNLVKEQSKIERNLKKVLINTLNDLEVQTGHHFEVKKFFPSLTDSSYLSMDDSKEAINYLKCNFPEMDTLYPVPDDTIRDLNIPSINVGTWGKDAHKMTERVYKPYTFQVLPELTKNLTLNLLSE